MLKITIPAAEFFDEGKQEFFTTKEIELQLEHSLISVSKWESKFHRAFLSKGEKTAEETREYVKAMTLTQNVDSSVYHQLTPANLREIFEYIENSMTATHFLDLKETSRGPAKETVTSELIYYWMVALTIPFECQKWHLNRLLTLIDVCNRKNQPAGKRRATGNEIRARNRALNESRKAQLGSRG
jgi:hypothetical protein